MKIAITALHFISDHLFWSSNIATLKANSPILVRHSNSLVEKLAEPFSAFWRRAPGLVKFVLLLDWSPGLTWSHLNYMFCKPFNLIPNQKCNLLSVPDPICPWEGIRRDGRPAHPDGRHRRHDHPLLLRHRLQGRLRQPQPRPQQGLWSVLRYNLLVT